MTEFDYGTLLSPEPIALSIGHIKKHTLREISRLTFPKFSLYESFLKITPKEIYESMFSKDVEGYIEWVDLPDDIRNNLSVYDFVLRDTGLQSLYQQIFDFFFVEQVVFLNDHFVIFERMNEDNEIDEDSVWGLINRENFLGVLDLIQQVCCIYKKREEEVIPVFKNSYAKKLYERMAKAKEERERIQAKQQSKDLSIPNIISKVSNRHPSLNPINIWDLTLFQLIDSFNCMQVNTVYDIDKTRVSVWGDEKKQFDITLWYKSQNKNEIDK